MVYVPDNLLDAGLVVVITQQGKGPGQFDAGRAAQNMMLAAWNEGVASCPNGIRDVESAVRALALAEGVVPVNIPSFGFPKRPLDPKLKSSEEWSAEANRTPLEELVTRL